MVFKVEPRAIDRGSQGLIDGLFRAIEILCNEDFPEVRGTASVEFLVRDILDEIDYLEEYGETA